MSTPSIRLIDPHPASLNQSQNSNLPLFDGLLDGIGHRGAHLEELLKRKANLQKSVVDLNTKMISVRDVQLPMKQVPEAFKNEKQQIDKLKDGFEKLQRLDALEDAFYIPFQTICILCENNVALADRLDEIEREISHAKGLLTGAVEQYRACVTANYKQLTKADRIHLSRRVTELNKNIGPTTGVRLFDPASVIQRSFQSHSLRKTVTDLIHINRQASGMAMICAAIERRSFTFLKTLTPTQEDRDFALQTALSRNDRSMFLTALRLKDFSTPLLASLVSLSIRSQNQVVAETIIQGLGRDFDAAAVLEELLDISPDLIPEFLELSKYPLPDSRRVLAIKALIQNEEFAVAETLAITPEQRQVAYHAASQFKTEAARSFQERLKAKGILFAEKHLWILDKIRKEPNVEALILVNSRDELALALVAAANEDDTVSIVRLASLWKLPFDHRKEAILATIRRGNFLGLIALLDKKRELGFALEAAAALNPDLIPRIIQEGPVSQSTWERTVNCCIKKESLKGLEALLQTDDDFTYAAQIAANLMKYEILCVLADKRIIGQPLRDDLIKRYIILSDVPFLARIVNSSFDRAYALEVAAQENKLPVFLEIVRWGEITQESMNKLITHAIRFEQPDMLKALVENPSFEGFTLEHVLLAMETDQLSMLLELKDLDQPIRHQAIRWAAQHHLFFIEMLIRDFEDRAIAVETAASFRNRELVEDLLENGNVPHDCLLRAEELLNS